jgi:hypothetical protein
VENLWSAGRQRRVASAQVADGGIEVSGDHHWSGLVNTALDGFGEGSPEDLLERLTHHFRSDYVFGTEPHDEGTCPFAHSGEVDFVYQPAPDRSQHPARA